MTFAGIVGLAETESCAGACTTICGHPAAETGIAVPSLASAPVPPEMVGESNPGCAAWYVQVKVAVPMAPKTSCGSGEETSWRSGPTVGAGNETPMAVAVPLFVTTSESETV